MLVYGSLGAVNAGPAVVRSRKLVRSSPGSTRRTLIPKGDNSLWRDSVRPVFHQLEFDAVLVSMKVTQRVETTFKGEL